MTKNSKAMRRVLCGVVSFLLSFFSCLFVMCLVFKFTVLSPSFLVGVEKRSDYAEALHSELKEQFVSYGSAGNVDESFFDSVFENIITMTVELGSWTRKKSLLVNLVLIFVLSIFMIVQSVMRDQLTSQGNQLTALNEALTTKLQITTEQTTTSSENAVTAATEIKREAHQRVLARHRTSACKPNPCNDSVG